MPQRMSLSHSWDQYMKRTDPYWENKENYRVQQEYIKMLLTEPVVHPSSVVKGIEPDDGSMDV